jgi:hypothetical protein
MSFFSSSPPSGHTNAIKLYHEVAPREKIFYMGFIKFLKVYLYYRVMQWQYYPALLSLAKLLLNSF